MSDKPAYIPVDDPTPPAVDEKPRARKLKNLHLNRVDLVTAGANPGAFVMIHKFEETDVDVDKKDFSQQQRDAMAGKGTAMPDGSFPIATTADLKNAIRSIGRAKDRAATIAHIKTRAKALGASDLIPDTFKSLEAIMDEIIETLVEVPVEETKVEVETVVETVAKADFEALQKSLEAATERLAKMEHEAKEVEFIAKAKDLSNLGAAPELGRLMLDINKNVSAESYKALEMLLKAANAQLEKGDLFASLGRADAEAATSDDRILELAKAKVAAGTAKTIELAKLDVMHENPDLRAEYLKAKRG